MNTKIIKTFILVTLLALLVGLASASEVSMDATSTPTTVDVSTDAVSTDTTFSTVKDTTPTTTESVQESVTGKQIENKIITKEEKNKKTASEFNVGNYDQLKEAFSSEDNEVTINITSNITLTDNPHLNSDINTLTIEGNGFTIDGNGQHIFLRIDSGTTTVNINNLTITNCHNYGYGGAIYNGYDGTLTITDSNLTHNTAYRGGAIYNEMGGNVTINNTNLNYNKAAGADDEDDLGGAILSVYGATLTITDSNLTHNTATTSGGAIYTAGTYKITNSTFYNNTPANYIVTENNGQYYLELNQTDNFINMNSVSLFVDDESTPRYSGSNLNEYSLPPGNYKINLVVNGSNPAQFNNNTFILDSQLDMDSFNVSDYPGLVYAVNYAKTTSYDNYTINLLHGNYNATANMKWGETTGSTRKLIINGNNITLDGIHKHQFMYVDRDYNLILKNITITNYIEQWGGAIDSSGNVTITDSTFTNNTATAKYEGGGAINNNGNITAINTTFTYNTATGQLGCGGAIYSNHGGNATITGSNLQYNNATQRGGAIYTPNGGTLNITDSNLNYNTITGSLGYGGAIYNQYGSTLIITYSNLTYNNIPGKNGYGGAIYNNGTLNITGSNLNDNNVTGEFGSGGAIHANAVGTLNINNSNLTHNNAPGEYGNGAAIHNEGTLNITNSNLKYNTATGQFGCGGAIYNTGSYTLNIATSNLTDNSAKIGGAIRSGGILNITDSNLTDNTAFEGGAIQNWKTLIISNSNLTNNCATQFGGAIYNINGTVNITLSNFTYNNATSGGAIHSNDTLNMTGSSLTYNTALQGGAIYNNRILDIKDCTLSFNKINIADTLGSNGGAVYNAGNLTIKNATLTNNEARYYGGAILNTNFHDKWNEIVYANITMTDSIIKNNIAGYDGGGIFNNATMTINNITLEYNNASSFGGAILNNGTMNINRSTLEYNSASWDGGAINNRNTLSIADSHFNYNNDTRSAGALYNDEGQLNITRTDFNYNNARNNGGAVENYNGNMSITDSSFTHNHADKEGGAISNSYGNTTINNTNFTQNYAKSGGVINLFAGNLNITSSLLKNNTATYYGGALYIDYGNLLSSNTNITYNKAECGGAAYNLGNLTVNKSNLTDNEAICGGAIYNANILDESSNQVESLASSTITDSTIKNNNAEEYIGGAIFNNGTMEIKNTTLENNNALSGGAVFNGAVLNISLSRFNNNTAENGGAISTYKSNSIITDTNLTGNKAIYGGALYHEESLIILNSTTFTQNNATCYGGAIYANQTGNNPEKSEEIIIIADGSDESEEIITIADGEEEAYTGIYTYNSTFNNNHAEIEGGAIYNENGTLNVTESIFTNNTAINASAISNYANASIYNNTFKTNKANMKGKAIIDENGNAEIRDNINDEISIYYGTIYTKGEDVKIIKNIFDDGILYTTIEINVNNTKPYVFDEVEISLLLKDHFNRTIANQLINLKVGDKTYNTTTNTKGIAKQKHKLTTNVTNVIATYNGNDIYNKTVNTTIINAQKLNTKIILAASNGTPLNNTTVTITATLKDAKNNNVSGQNIKLNIAGTNVTVKTNANGTATYKYTPTTLGKQTITATYPENNQYKAGNATTTITVKKLDTKITLTVSNKTPVLNTSINITVTLKDSNNNAVTGQNITLNIAGKTFTVKTNASGTAIQAYTPTKAETQIIKATYKGNSQYTQSNATTNITVKKINTQLTLKVSNTTPVNNTPINITVTLKDANNKTLSNQNVTLTVGDKKYNLKTNANATITQTYTPVKIETLTITATYNGNSQYTGSTKTTNITVRNKYNTNTVVNSVSGIIGEKLTLKATVTDENNKKVTNGNVIFKINGVTIKDNGKLSGSNNPLKVKVVNGVATTTITPDVSMKSAQTITASYVGTDIYNKSTSTPANINISPRNATIEITTNVKKIKQGQVLTITAKIYDTTNGKKSTNLSKFDGEYVYFKVNGITLKDENGQMLKVKVVNGMATLNYTVPLGISCVLDTQTMTPKNHTIQVGFYNKNYQDIISNNPHFQVERSPITINLANATINNKTHTLSMKITIKDYLGNTVAGPNKCIIKVNGVTLKNGTTVMYYYTTDGVLELKNTPVPQAKNYTSVEVITQDRLAYKSQRSTTTVIKVLNN